MRTLAIIEKELVSELSFTKEDVLSTPELRKQRFAELQRAQTLGNLLQTKVSIIFETKDGNHHQVHTTIWAVGDEFIALKGGKSIPIRAIHAVH